MLAWTSAGRERKRSGRFHQSCANSPYGNEASAQKVIWEILTGYEVDGFHLNAGGFPETRRVRVQYLRSEPAVQSLVFDQRLNQRGVDLMRGVSHFKQPHSRVKTRSAIFALQPLDKRSRGSLLRFRGRRAGQRGRQQQENV